MKRLYAVLAAAAAIAVAGCGGGDNTNNNQTTTGARVSQGALTQVASNTITLNGATIDDSTARITVDDNPTGHEALQPGMVVTVKVDDKGKATEIRHHAQVRGAVEDKGASTVTIGGQTVRVDDSTHFDDDVARLGGIKASDHVRVSGFPDDRGGLRATRISHETSTEFEVHGIASGVTATGFTLKISPTATSSFTVTLASGVTMPAGIKDGSIVEVKSASVPAAGSTAIVASSVKLDDDLSGEAEAELEGIVTSGTSSSFVVNGRTVTTTSATKWVGGAPADLVVGVKVEAEGALDSAGNIAAKKVSFGDSLRLQGAATVFTPDASATGAAAKTNGTFTMFGGAITVHVSDVAELEVDLTTLAAGAALEVRGYPGSTDGSIVATRVRLATSGGGGQRIFIQGPVTAADATGKKITILVFTIDVSQAQLKNRDETTAVAGDFFASVAQGTVVKARADSAAAFTAATKTLVASEVELEDDK